MEGRRVGLRKEGRKRKMKRRETERAVEGGGRQKWKETRREKKKKGEGEKKFLTPFPHNLTRARALK